MRQLSKQRSVIEEQAAALEEKKDVLIVEEKAATGSVSVECGVGFMY